VNKSNIKKLKIKKKKPSHPPSPPLQEFFLKTKKKSMSPLPLQECKKVTKFMPPFPFQESMKKYQKLKKTHAPFPPSRVKKGNNFFSNNKKLKN